MDESSRCILRLAIYNTNGATLRLMELKSLILTWPLGKKLGISPVRSCCVLFRFPFIRAALSDVLRELKGGWFSYCCSFHLSSWLAVNTKEDIGSRKDGEEVENSTGIREKKRKSFDVIHVLACPRNV